MISVINDPYDIDVKYNWEEDDLLLGKTLSHHNEQRLLGLARELRDSLMNVPLTATGDELQRVLMEQSNLRGKYELILFLIEESKEAKLIGTITPNT